MDIIAATRELGKAIQADERFKALEKAQEASEKDTKLQGVIGEFNLKRMTVNEEVAKEDKDEKKLAQLNSELKDLYESVMSNENMAAFNSAKQEMDKVVGNINAIIVASLNGDDPDGVDINASCSGSCSNCEGCH